MDTGAWEAFSMNKDVMIVTGAGQIGMAIARRPAILRTMKGPKDKAVKPK